MTGPALKMRPEQFLDCATQKPPVLVVKDLRVGYGPSSNTLPVVHGVNFEVRKGEVLAIVGESGSGKTTCIQSLFGLLPKGGRITSGSIQLNGQEIAGWDERRLETLRGDQVGFVPQDPITSLNPVRRIGEQIFDILAAHRGMGREAARRKSIAILSDAGLVNPENLLRRYPGELSGGMCQRVLIGMALACDPVLVIADEPTSALDVTVQRKVLDHLDRLTRERHTAVLLVTHDLGVAADRADRIIVMNQGVIVEEGPSKKILNDPQSDYARRLVRAVPALSPYRRRGGHSEMRSDVSVKEAPRSTEPEIEIRNLVKEFGRSGKRPHERVIRAVSDVSFTIRAGETLALVGESGSGKTTTARMLLRLVEPTSGSIRINGEDVTHARGRQLRNLRARMQVVYQNPFASLNPRFSIEEIIAEPLRAFNIGDRPSRKAAVARLLEQVSLPGSIAQRRSVELSGGQRQRVAIARALALRPQVLVLDEPVSALDVSVQAQILQLIVELQEELNMSYLFISHDLAVVRQVSDHVAVMQGGSIVEFGRCKDVLDAPKHAYTQELIGSIPGKMKLSG